MDVRQIAGRSRAVQAKLTAEQEKQQKIIDAIEGLSRNDRDQPPTTRKPSR